MENNEIKDPLYELKDQMLVLKQQLSKQTIINEEQTKNIVSEYKPAHPYIWVAIGALTGLVVAGNSAWRLVTKFTEMSLWEILIITLFILIVMIFYAYIGARSHTTTYSIKDETLYFSNLFSKLFRDSMEIPIRSIRYIEFLSRGPKERRVRIVFNKFDDLYIYTRNVEGLITDLLRVNPDIEIRSERK